MTRSDSARAASLLLAIPKKVRMHHGKPNALLTVLGFVGLVALLVSIGCGGGSTLNGNGGGSTSTMNGNTGGATASVPVAATVADTVNVGSSPTALTVDPTTNTVYVVNFPAVCTNVSPAGFGSVTWIDGATDSVVGSDTNLPLEFTEPSSYETAGPVAVATDSATNTVYVAMQGTICRDPSTGKSIPGNSSVLAFDVATKAASVSSTLLSIGAPASPGSIAVDRTRGKLYLADNVANEVRVIDLATNSSNVLAVPGKNPIALAVNPMTNIIYVANQGSNDITVLDGTTGSTSTISNTNAVSPSGITVNQATNTVYMANGGSNNVTVLEGSTGLTASFPVGTSPVAIAADPQTNFIYVANHGNSPSGDPGSISVINGATNTTAMVSDPKAKNPVAVAVDPATNKIYVANSGSNNLTVLNGAHN